jgi:hypothetical protein
MPPGAEAEIVNTAPAPDPDPYYFIKDLKKVYCKKINCYYFNPKTCINPRNKVDKPDKEGL